jgi:hypothetical protein
MPHAACTTQDVGYAMLPAFTALYKPSSLEKMERVSLVFFCELLRSCSSSKVALQVLDALCPLMEAAIKSLAVLQLPLSYVQRCK